MQTTFLDGVVCLVFLIVQVFFTDILATVAENYSGDIWVPGITSGFLAAFGIISANYAVLKGLAGPASAIVNCSTVIQTLMDYFILNQLLNLMQLSGFLFGLLGAMIFAVGKEIRNGISGLCRRSKSD
jgi:uncharacterized membrane protein